MAAMELAAGARVAGKFELVRPLAKGGMGTLWIATNLQLGVPIAIKLLAHGKGASPDASGPDRELAARFEREAQAAARIRSPNVVHVYEHGVYEGTPFIVMELLEGEDLQQRLTREKSWPLDRAAPLIRDVARVLHRAHEMGIVHRDLKPANLFLARNEDTEILKVLDFGVAKVQGDARNITGTGEIIGTMAYMSPEQLRGAKDADHRADLWSLAGVAFRIVTGKLPFGGTAEALQAILSGKVPVASREVPALGPAVDAFFARAFAPDIADRFQTARELSEAFVSLVPAVSGASGIFEVRFSAPPDARPLPGTATTEKTTPLIGKSTLAVGPAPLAFLPPQVLPSAPQNVPIEPPPSTLTSQVVRGGRRSIGAWIAIVAVGLLVSVWVVLLAVWLTRR